MKPRGRPLEFDSEVRVPLTHEQKVYLRLMAAGLNTSQAAVVRYVLEEYRAGSCKHLICLHEPVDPAPLLGLEPTAVSS